MSLDPDPQGSLDHAMVLAPYRKDADYLCQLLVEHEIQVDVCPDVSAVAECLARSPGVIVTTHEALTPTSVATIADYLERQPPWSELPIIVLLDRTSPNLQVRTELARSWPRARQIFYQRPVTPVELISGVQAALLARLRQRDVRDHIDREIELRRELNHRVKNILASVASIFEMTQRGADSLESFAEDFRGRMRALSDVHAAVFQAEGEAVSVADIVDLTFAPYRSRDTDRVSAAGPDLLLSRPSATTLALCLHELTTNAIKYGALSVPEGRVSLTWMIDGPELELVWTETGGPSVREPARAGYGTRYLRAALTSLFGAPPALKFHPEGLICRARGSLARIACNP